MAGWRSSALTNCISLVPGLAKQAVTFDYADESDGVDPATGVSSPFYPIPPEAATQSHFVEGGEPGNVDRRSAGDRHLIIVDRDARHLYELYNVFFDGARWHAGSGAFFDMNANIRRPDGWTSADAAGLAILPGLVRYDEAASGHIDHAIRVTFDSTRDAWVHPASHCAGDTAAPDAPAMGTRLRLKAGYGLGGFSGGARTIAETLKRYGMIVADNGSNWYFSGSSDRRWDDENLDQLKRIPGSAFQVVRSAARPHAC